MTQRYSIRMHERGWAVCVDGEPIVLFPATASGYSRAAKLLLDKLA